METRATKNKVLKINHDDQGSRAFNLIKKLADLIDDIWNALRGGLIPEAIVKLIGPFLVGSIQFIIHIGEGYQAAKAAYEAYMDKQIGQRKTRLLTNSLTLLLAGGGVGLSMWLIIGALSGLGIVGGVVLSGMAFFPVIIPALLTGIYALSLWRKAYVFDRAKEDEEKAKHLYDLYILRPDHDKVEADKLFSTYTNAYQKRIGAEREVAFTTIEFFASAMVTTGIVLGAVALLGAASVATFGALPLALLITGVLIGFISKVIEHKDEKKDFSYTKSLRNFFFKHLGKKSDEPCCQHRNVPALENHKEQTQEGRRSQCIARMLGQRSFLESESSATNQYLTVRELRREVSDFSHSIVDKPDKNRYQLWSNEDVPVEKVVHPAPLKFKIQ